MEPPPQPLGICVFLHTIDQPVEMRIKHLIQCLLAKALEYDFIKKNWCVFQFSFSEKRFIHTKLGPYKLMVRTLSFLFDT